MSDREVENPMPLDDRCQECLCPLCRYGSTCHVCHGQGIGQQVRKILTDEQAGGRSSDE